MNNIIYIYGQDKRQQYIQKMLNAHGYNTINVSLQNSTRQTENYYTSELNDSEILLLPVPVSDDILNSIIPFVHSETYILSGNLSDDFINICNTEHAHLFNYMKLPTVAIKNAVATAEGAICEAIKASSENLQDSKALVIGYGKCGSVLCDKLYGLKSHVHVLTRSTESAAHTKAAGYKLFDGDFSKYKFIFNTAPANIINQSVIDNISPDCTIIDIASAPGGTDFEYCRQKGITALLCLGLPAKYSPKTSAAIIFEECIKYLEQIPILNN